MDLLPSLLTAANLATAFFALNLKFRAMKFRELNAQFHSLKRPQACPEAIGALDVGFALHRAKLAKRR